MFTQNIWLQMIYRHWDPLRPFFTLYQVGNFLNQISQYVVTLDTATVNHLSRYTANTYFTVLCRSSLISKDGTVRPILLTHYRPV